MKLAPVPIPPEAMLDNALILGKPGAGKSALARLIFEREMDAGHRAIFVDPMGDAAGIRLMPDGLRASRFKDVVIIGGPNANLPMTDQDGAKVGRFVAQQRRSFLIDLSDMIQAEQLRFMVGFAEHLYEDMAVPAIVMIDEAHIFAPQDRGEGSSVLTNRMVRLNSQGRKRGIFLWLMTQRPARISKNIIGGTETLIAMKMAMPRDLDAVQDWLSAHDPKTGRDARLALPRMEAGGALVWNLKTEFFAQVQFPFHSTFDSGRTPQHGELVKKIDIPKVTDLDSIAAAFGVTSTGDPRDELIDDLRVELSDAKTAVVREAEERVRWKSKHDQVAIREERAIQLLLALQLRIGAAIGSQQIEALPITEPYDEYTMVEGRDGIIRPIPRAGDNPALVVPARRRVANAKIPTPPKKRTS